MAKVSLFHPGADRALRRFRGADAPVTRDDEHLYASGDERPNTGLREGVVAHAEVNDVIRGCDMSVTLAQGPDLLVFHHAREHQAFHMGRTRRTLYLPEPVLHKAFDMGYDYWALTEVLIQESWPLDYILLYELVRRLQDRFKTHLTLRLRQFVALRADAPDNKHLFTLLAALLVRLDGVEEYDGVLVQLRGLGDYASPALQEIVYNDELFNVEDTGRGRIYAAARPLLEEA